MKSKTLDVPVNNPKTIEPFEVTQALVATDIGGIEASTLAYFSYFTKVLPTSAAYFLHVIPEVTFIAGLFEKVKKSPFEGHLSKDVIKIMEERVAPQFQKADITYIEFDVKEGNPLEALLDTSKKLEADLVVLGQKRGAHDHGILSKKLVRKINSNALIIPEGSDQFIGNILVPIDFSENSAKALLNAIAIKKQLGEEVDITALYVYTMPDLSAYKIDRPYTEYQNMVLTNLKEGFVKFLDKYIPDNKDWVKTELVYKDMPGIAGYIMEYAEEEEVDFVIIGAKGHSKVDLLLLGSVTEKFLHINRTIPTLVIK